MPASSAPDACSTSSRRAGRGDWRIRSHRRRSGCTRGPGQAEHSPQPEPVAVTVEPGPALSSWSPPLASADDLPTPRLSARLGVVTMCAGAPASAVRSHLAYHRAIGFERVFLYLDDASDEYWQSLALPDGGDGVVVTRCDATFWRRLLRSSAMVARRSEQSVFEDAARWWETEVQSRQSLCVEHAVVRASAEGLDWLLHIDIDEAFLRSALAEAWEPSMSLLGTFL